MKRVLFLLVFVLTFVACGPSQSEYDSLVAKNEELIKEIEELKSIIENYENTPDRLYSGVPELVKEKNIASLSSIHSKLKQYHPNSPECKKVKDALDKLIAEKEAKEKAELEKRRAAVNKLKKKHDDVSGITWYLNPYFTHYNNTNHVSIYICQEYSKVWLRLVMSYEGDKWIFFKNAYLSYDGNTITIPFDDYEEKKTDSGYGGRVWEWIDVSVSDSQLKFLKDMINGKSLKMRLSGKYTHDHSISSTEKKALQDVLLAYDVLKNGI